MRARRRRRLPERFAEGVSRVRRFRDEFDAGAKSHPGDVSRATPGRRSLGVGRRVVRVHDAPVPLRHLALERETGGRTRDVRADDEHATPRRGGRVGARETGGRDRAAARGSFGGSRDETLGVADPSPDALGDVRGGGVAVVDAEIVEVVVEGVVSVAVEDASSADLGGDRGVVASYLLLVAARDAGFPETTEPHDGVVVFVAGGERGSGRGGALGGGDLAVAVPDVGDEEGLAIPSGVRIGATQGVAVGVAVGARVEEGDAVAAGAEEGVLAGAFVRVRAGGGVGDEGHPHDHRNHEESANELTTSLAFPSRGAERVVPAKGRQAVVGGAAHHVGGVHPARHRHGERASGRGDECDARSRCREMRVQSPCHHVRQQACPTDRVFSRPFPQAGLPCRGASSRRLRGDVDARRRPVARAESASPPPPRARGAARRAKPPLASRLLAGCRLRGGVDC